LQKGAKLTLECSKDSCGLSGTATVATTGFEMGDKNCGSDEASEPEEHCQTLYTSDDPWMRKAFELPRCKAEVDQGKKRPDRIEH